MGLIYESDPLAREPRPARPLDYDDDYDDDEDMNTSSERQRLSSPTGAAHEPAAEAHAKSSTGGQEISSTATSTRSKTNTGRAPLPLGPSESAVAMNGVLGLASAVGNTSQDATAERLPKRITSLRSGGKRNQTASSVSSEAPSSSSGANSESGSSTMQAQSQDEAPEPGTKSKDELLAFIEEKRAKCVSRAQAQNPPGQPNRKTLNACKLAKKVVEDGTETNKRCQKCRGQGWPCFWSEGSRSCAVCTVSKVAGCTKGEDHEDQQTKKMASDRSKGKRK